MAGHVGLELRNVDANYPLERSHRFAGIQPNCGRRDYSPSSCDGGSLRLAPESHAHEDFVFTVNGRTPLNGWSKYKDRLDGKMRHALQEQGVELKPWQLRDLRRTARTLMSRAGIPPRLRNAPWAT